MSSEFGNSKLYEKSDESSPANPASYSVYVVNAIYVVNTVYTVNSVYAVNEDATILHPLVQLTTLRHS